jgi:putative acetyltransferase
LLFLFSDGKIFGTIRQNGKKQMSGDQTNIVRYSGNFNQQLVSVWEKSVRATHDFLDPTDIDYFKTIVVAMDFNAIPVFCLTRRNSVLGFFGVVDRNFEMLFLSPEHNGQGLGRTLVNFAVTQLHADKVDVNEQKQKAVDFYLKLGFVSYERLEKDSEGKDYPILKMKLKTDHATNC